MQVHIISKEAVKPSSPTPPHLRSYKLSFLDNLPSPTYTARVLFYTTTKSSSDICYHLKTSLSETLTKYYPFAGRLSGGATIDCNDQGAEFIEARVICTLSSILKSPKAEDLHQLFPNGLVGNDSYKGGLVVIQFNSFECGGIAVSVCFSHRIADGSTMAHFMAGWAAVACQASDEVQPMFISEEPGSWPETISSSRGIRPNKEPCTTRRFVFDAANVAKLKAIAEKSGVENPTRVEVVTALFYKCATAAVAGNRRSVLAQTVNLRPRTDPPLPGNSVGNFCWYFIVSMDGERDMALHEVLRLMRKGRSEFYAEYGESLQVKDWFTVVREKAKEAKRHFEGNADFISFNSSSMCRFPFYEVDFGWGRPIWAALPGKVFKNTLVLMDTPSKDGIEAWVTLGEKEMVVFESDLELLPFCSLNPSVV
ncbi:Deacetylvindoline O-acetyltransferase [Bertholletia excelsa]